MVSLWKSKPESKRVEFPLKNEKYSFEWVRMETGLGKKFFF